MHRFTTWLGLRLLTWMSAALDANDALDMQTAMQDAQAPIPHPSAPMQGMDAAMQRTGASLNVRAATRVLRHDLGFVVLGCGIVIALAVSTPATFLVVEPFHHDNLVLAILSCLLIGFAAVVCKLTTLILPEFTRRLDLLTIALLTVEWFSNYAHGLDLFTTAALGSTFGSIRAAGFGPVAALIYASIPPLFLFAFLHMAVTRARRLLYNLTAIEMQQKLAPVREAMQLVSLMQQELQQIGRGMQPPALPDATYARPDAPEQVQYAPPVPSYACMKCGAYVAGAAQRAASKRWGCAQCKTP